MVPYEVLVSHSHPLGHVHRQGLEDDQIDGRGVVGNLVPVVAFMVQLEDEGVGGLEGQPALLVEGHRPDLAVALLQMIQQVYGLRRLPTLGEDDDYVVVAYGTEVAVDGGVGMEERGLQSER